MKSKWLLACCAYAAMSIAAASAAERLKCGVVTEPLDWNKSDLHGNLAPLGGQICRAVAVALFGAADRLDVQSYDSEQDALAGLRGGKSDIVAGVTPRAAAANTARFSVPFFQDGQGFMVHRAEGIATLADLSGHKLCYIEDTDNDRIALADLAARGVRPVPFGFQEEGEMDAAIMDRHCQATTAYLSKLAEARASFRNGRDYVFLQDMLTVIPLTVAVGTDRPRLSAIVDATISVLLEAESLGVTRNDAVAPPSSTDPRRQRLFGEDWATAQGLALAHDWSRKVVAAVGNYAEIYSRTVGPGTAMNLPRGINALWNKGGVMAPLPLQ